MFFVGSLKAHNLQVNLNYKKYMACHTVHHFTYAHTETVTFSQDLSKKMCLETPPLLVGPFKIGLRNNG